MTFALGYIAGLLTALVLLVLVMLLRTPISKVEKMVQRTTSAVDRVSPFGTRGFVHVPPDDDEIARQEIIEANASKGRDTKIEELRS